MPIYRSIIDVVELWRYITHNRCSTGAQDPIAALFSEKLSQYRKLAAAEGDMVGVSDADVAKQQDQLERLKKMYAVQGDVLSFPEAKF